MSMGRSRCPRSRSLRNFALPSSRLVRWMASRMTLVVPDTSTWARRTQPNVGALLSDAIERNDVVIAVPVLLELLWSARNAYDLTEQASEYNALHQAELTPAVGRRAVAVPSSTRASRSATRSVAERPSNGRVRRGRRCRGLALRPALRRDRGGDRAAGAQRGLSHVRGYATNRQRAHCMSATREARRSLR